jgi:DNA-binding transcriptional LysR family regulator
LPAFRRRHPGVEVVFQLAGESEQLQMLHDGQIHAGFLRVPAVDHALTVKPIFSEPLVAVLPARHPLARRRSVTLAELRDERFIFFPRRFAPTYYDALMAIFRDAGVEPRIVHDTNRLHTVLSLVATGRGVSLTGKCVERLGRPGIVCRPLRPRVPNIEMAIAYDSRNPSPLLRSFLAVVARVFPPVR